MNQFNMIKTFILFIILYMHKLDILNNPIYKLCMDELKAHDKMWIKRKRISDTTFIFDILQFN